MKKKLFLIIVLQIFIFSGFAQNKTTKSTGTVTTQTYVEPVDPPGTCDNCPTGYQWNRDSDGDGYGDPNDYVFSQTKPSGYVANQQDCDDTNKLITTSSTIWYRDVDGDGHGAKNGPTTAGCLRPIGFTSINDDLDDNNKLITNITPQKFYFDNDGDTFGDPNISVMASPGQQPDKYVTNNLDLDDQKSFITNIPPRMYYWDKDRDGYGDAGRVGYSILASPGHQIDGYVDKDGDCNDEVQDINPETKWYADIDGDNLGDPLDFVQQCIKPGANYVRDYTDNCPAVYGTSADCSTIPVPDLNYIISTTYKKETAEIFVNPTPDQAQTNITYFDGLGRPIQQIANQHTATGKDIITHIDYDNLGRQTKEFLPFASNQTTLSFMLPSVLEHELTNQYKTNYGNTNDNPFSGKQLETSPLNRVLKQAAPGGDWKSGSGHEIKIDYQSNISGELTYYYAATTWNPALGLYNTTLSSGIYVANELYKTITYDENTASTPSEINGSTVEFKNKQGQVVLKRTYGTVETSTVNEKHDTYYVYDIYGNLTFVIPPKASDLMGGSSATEANITSTAIITSGNSLQLTATNSIRLLPGFHAQTGSTFSAVINSNSNSSENVLDNLCYQYKYDSQNRLAEKKLPGKQWEFIVYDKLDRPVATGPANSPFSDISTTGWLITKYDAFNRPVYTGWMNSTPATSTGRTELQTAQNSVTLTVLNETKLSTGNLDNIPAYYTNVVEPKTFKLLTVNYYDNYTFPSTPTIAIPTNIEGQTTLSTDQVKGLATASWTRVLTSGTANIGETTATFYDAKARPVRIYTQNYIGGYTYTDSKLDAFSGQLQYSITRHKRTVSDAELMTKDAFTYSAQDRLLTQTHQINGAEPAEVLLSNTYDELGQLISKRVGNNAQNVNYAYNIRGWLENINDINALSKADDPKDLFAIKINYTTTNTLGVDPLYNGNITETYWTSASEANPFVRGYGYTYDKLNRLKTSIFKKDGTVNNTYNENLAYDKNGNIMSLLRNGNNEITSTQIDNLVYSYGPGNLTNQLTKVIDSSDKSLGFIDNASNTVDDYSYDGNGNMIKDNNKNITSITYNHLNLPTKIVFASAENIVYIYNASGQKIQKIVNRIGNTAITDYLGGYQYLNNTLKFFPTAEGYVEPSGSSYKYVYQYKDHLGNIRLSYDKTLAIQEENNYYPFGLKQMGYNGAAPSSNDALKYKFQGQERQDELGLGWDSFKWRNYDPAIGRFMSVDPLTEKYRDWAPYVFSGNRVIDSRELEGLEPITATLALEVEFAPETLAAETAGADFTVALEGMTVEAVPRVSMWETVGNFFGELWETVAGGSDVKTDLIPKNAMEGAIDKAKPKANEKEKANDKPYAPDEPLRKQKNGEPKVDSEAEGKKHTQLGTKQGRKGKYTQGREFDEKGNPVKDIDHTDHGRPDTHPDNPHQHTWEPSKTGGTPQRSKLPTKIE